MTDDMEDDNGGGFSKLEASFTELKIERRRISLDILSASRHADKSDLIGNDLDFNYSIKSDSIPQNLFPSIQNILPALQYNSHLANPNNFANETNIGCFDQTDDYVAFRKLDDTGLDKVLNIVKEDSDMSDRDAPSATVKPTSAAEKHPLATPRTPSALVQPPSPNLETALSAPDPTCTTTEAFLTTETNNGRILVFFIPLIAKKEGTFGLQVPMHRLSVQKLFDVIGVNPEFILNMLGRPDYWSPRTRWQYNMRDELVSCDYFCQHPRWNLHHQGAPLSVYMIRRVKSRLTTYIISHQTGDSSVHALQQILKVGVDLFPMKSHPPSLLTNPFEIAVLLSSLSLEASKFHVARFRRYMWQQVNKVDDHLAGLESSDRSRLTELTKSLQIISQQADSHLLNINVAIATAIGIRDAHAKFHDFLSTPILFRQPVEDAIKYVIDSMKKQKMLFLNYKSRKDSTMSLVYNLVTQSDAANNIELAKSMKSDSTSMSSIAALTMLFLPGTFTSSILSAGIFSSRANSDGISTSGLWWLWVTLTFPLTAIVMGAWWVYKRMSQKKYNASKSNPQPEHQNFWSKKPMFDKLSSLGRKNSFLGSNTQC